MARNSLYIVDEYSDRDDLTRLQKWRLRHPEQIEISRQYSKNYIKENPNHLRAWRINNPEKHREQNKRSNYKQRLKRYGLTEESYNALLESQNNMCAICLGPNTTKHGWHIDHNHITGETRGILCHHCNLMIGNAKESILRLEQGIAYLEYHDKS